MIPETPYGGFETVKESGTADPVPLFVTRILRLRVWPSRTSPKVKDTPG